MANLTNSTITVEGQEIPQRVGVAVIVVQRINAGAFRLSIRHASNNAEVPELCRTFPNQRRARHVARTAAVLFRSGLNINDVLRLLAAR